jgi:hypothetical protein
MVFVVNRNTCLLCVNLRLLSRSNQNSYQWHVSCGSACPNRKQRTAKAYRKDQHALVIYLYNGRITAYISHLLE